MSIIIHKIHIQLLRKAQPDGHIQRCVFFRVVAERLGKLESKEKYLIIRELKNQKVILDSNKISFKLKVI